MTPGRHCKPPLEFGLERKEDRKISMAAPQLYPRKLPELSEQHFFHAFREQNYL